MQSYTVRFHIDAPPRKVWRVLHPPVPPNSPRPRVLKWPTGSMEILNEGDEAGEGLVRTCVFEVPKYLLSGGKGRSWETVTEAKLNKLSRYVAVGKPLWSRAEGYHELEEQPDGTTVLTFHETYLRLQPGAAAPTRTSRAREDLSRQPRDVRARAGVRRPRHATGLATHQFRSVSAHITRRSLHRAWGRGRARGRRRVRQRRSWLTRRPRNHGGAGNDQDGRTDGGKNLPVHRWTPSRVRGPDGPWTMHDLGRGGVQRWWTTSPTPHVAAGTSCGPAVPLRRQGCPSPDRRDRRAERIQVVRR